MTSKKEFKKYIKDNNIQKVISLLKDANFTGHDNSFINTACIIGRLDILKLFLNDDRYDPSDNANFPIRHAIQFNHTRIKKLLWKDNRIKNTLKNDHLKLYNKLIKEDVLNKVDNF